MRRWLGVGTGRCGTQSLAMIFKVRHEAHIVPWGSPPEAAQEYWLSQGESQVNMFLTPYVGAIREVDPELPVVCLYRDPQEVVESFLRARKGGFRNGARYFPPWDHMDPREAWTKFVTEMQAMMDAVKEPVFRMQTEELNDDTKIQALHQWLYGKPFEDLSGARWRDIKGAPSEMARRRFINR